jgi:hypothetical protein
MASITPRSTSPTWARARQADLLANWDHARGDGVLSPIDPLK